MTVDRSAALSTEMLIGERWVSESEGGTMEHVNPATGKVQKSFPVASVARWIRLFVPLARRSRNGGGGSPISDGTYCAKWRDCWSSGQRRSGWFAPWRMAD